MDPNCVLPASVGEVNQHAETDDDDTVHEHEERVAIVFNELPPATALEQFHKKLADEAHLRPSYPAAEYVYMLVRISSSSTIKPDLLTGVRVYSEHLRHLSTPLPPYTIWSEWIYGSSLYTREGIKFNPIAGVSTATDGSLAAQGGIGAQIYIAVEAHGWTLGVQEMLKTRVHQYFERNHKGRMNEIRWIKHGSLGIGKGAYWNDRGLLTVWWEVVKADVSYLKDEGKDPTTWCGDQERNNTKDGGTPILDYMQGYLDEDE